MRATFALVRGDLVFRPPKFPEVLGKQCDGEREREQQPLFIHLSRFLRAAEKGERGSCKRGLLRGMLRAGIVGCAGAELPGFVFVGLYFRSGEEGRVLSCWIGFERQRSEGSTVYAKCSLYVMNRYILGIVE